MALSSMKASLMATMPTPSWRYQQGLPRRVMLPSMMSSETRKKACSSSVIQPSVAVLKYSSSVSGRPRRIEALSGTDMPRLHLPPSVLTLRLCFPEGRQLAAGLEMALEWEGKRWLY